MYAVRGKCGFVKKSKAERCGKVSRVQFLRHSASRHEVVAKQPDHDLRKGRRIVDLKTLATNMWCDNCNDSLSLRHLQSEESRGLASIFTVRCHRCLALAQVISDKPTRSPKSGRLVFSVNCKAAFACIDTGVAHDQLNKFLSAVNVPPIPRNTMKVAEGIVSPAIIQTAHNSCQEAIEEERELTLKALRSEGELSALPEERAVDNPAFNTSNASDSPTEQISEEWAVDDPAFNSSFASDCPTEEISEEWVVDDPFNSSHASDCRTEQAEVNQDKPDDVVPITCKYDFGWNKRGNGHAYDSHSGHGSAIGNYTNKVVAYDAMSKYCALCARGHSAQDHECAINYGGSSKGMEPFTAVKILLKNEQFSQGRVRLGTLVGDADSSTMAALSRESAFPIRKFLDLNHGLKAFSRALWVLKKSTFKWLTAEAIKNLTSRCLGYALAQNRGDVEATRRAIMNIPEHVYGNHTSCGDWCKAKDNPNYVFKDFPSKQPLRDPAFKATLIKMLQDMADNAEQLAPGGSTQQNESFNHMVATRAPKSRHYCGTNSNYLRVSATVSYKNLGAEHSEAVFKSANLSPTVNAFRVSVQRRREWKARYQSRLDDKRRRLHLKTKNLWAEADAARKDGPSYESGMSGVMERAVASSDCSSDWLPPPCDISPDCAVVYVDIETTGFLATDQIVQVAAKCGDRQFSVFMMPTVSFHAIASAKTGFKVFRGELMYREEVLTTTPPLNAAEQFITFLAECGPQVLLVGHNIIRFDAPRIVQWLEDLSCLKDFCEVVCGFTDTKPLIKQGKVGGQEELAKTYLVGPEWEVHRQGAHNASSDVILLEGLVRHFKVGVNTLKTSAVSSREFFMNRAMLKRRRFLLPQLAELKGKVSDLMIGRMAAHGVTISDLQREFDKNGVPGLTIFLGMHINGKPRVTASKKIVNAIAEHISGKENLPPL
ncbi:uncharacterized protein LOC117645265 [Thrips palmi]|uniref:Uncharacterized protein LOC117645265 n=1 Tax=Thrips palmi TaxID=161013 RepID=A0A6P8ZMU6_THRPL|nr:uncharacterized protein LOC117645265 [Thrips palmi]